MDAPFWAYVWDRTVQHAPDADASVDSSRITQPRIEPEVVFKLRAPVHASNDAEAILADVEWMAAGFEIVNCPYPAWRFTLGDAVAAGGLHGALFIGPPVEITDVAKTAEQLHCFELTLSRNGEVVERGTGANVLDSPALALGHLARVLADQGQPAVAEGEVVTTGTVTNAWPIAPGETWSSDYGTLGLTGLTLQVR